MEQLLTIRDLRVWFNVRVGLISGLLGKEVKHVRAVDGISFDVKRGEVFCLVGESGCGKTTTGKGLIRLNAPTGGNVFFDVPDDEWNRFVAMEKRLRELEKTLVMSGPAGSPEASALWEQVRRLTRQLELAKNPPGEAAQKAHRDRLEKTKSFLDDREQELQKGVDPAMVRIMSKDRERLELMETRGFWFTPARARKLEKTEKELKEAQYRAMRARSLHERTGKVDRRVRGLQRRIERIRHHFQTGNPETLKRVNVLRRDIEGKQKRLTALELSRVREERKGVEERLRSLTPTTSPTADAEIAAIESRIAMIRKQGGAGLEALELRAQLKTIGGRYDLARWGTKGRPDGESRRGRRKRYRLRMRELRRRMQIIYQDPYESLNPKLSIYDIVAEPLLANRITSTQSEAQAVVAKALEDVGLRPANEYMFRYPHELSGGQRQRVGIATALVVDPDFIVADEPVSMLDASVRTEILALLLELKKRRNLTYLFITHDLGLAWILADHIAVMYLGKIVEMGNGPEIIRNPRHPYTKALISVVPSPNPSIHREKTILRGERPNAVDIPNGCRFHPRCPVAVGICGWDSEEVRAELEKLFQEDRKTFDEARTVSAVAAPGSFAVTLTTPDPARVESYLRKRIQAVALKRPALGAIRKMAAKSGSLELELHKPIEPPLQRITGDITVACHLVEPEADAVDDAEPEAIAAPN